LTVVVGIEGGATRSTALATDASGHALARLAGDAIAVRGDNRAAVVGALRSLTENVLQQSNRRTPCAVLSCHLTGAGRAEERASLERELMSLGLADVVVVGTDAEAALADAFQEGEGILLIAGTGSIAWGRNVNGELARAGGWGPIAGDEGSAWSIGRSALQAVLASHDGRATATALTARILEAANVEEPPMLVRWAENAGKKGVAGLAALVLEEASVDGAAQAIVLVAVEDLVSQASAVMNRLGPWPHGICLALAGGLLAMGRPLRNPVRERLLRSIPGAEIVDRDVDGARGAAWLARRELGR
jgi:glucosamine kinase